MPTSALAQTGVGGHAGSPAMTAGPMPSSARAMQVVSVTAILDGNILEVLWSNRTSTTMYYLYTPVAANATLSIFGSGAVTAHVEAWRLSRAA